MPLLETLIPQVTGGIMGIASDAIGQARTERLMRQQVKNQMKLTDYNAKTQLQMWKDTSYGAQKEQMELAGINPGLLYGMSGGGGATTGGGAPGAAMGTAPNNTIAGMGIAMQAQLLKAQKENIEADTKLKEVDATKRAGVDTENIKADIVLKQIQQDWDKIDLEIKNRSKEDAIRKITYEADEAAYRANIAEGEGNVVLDENVIKARRSEIVTRAATAIIEKDIAELTKGKTSEEINKIRQEIKNGITQIINQTKQVDNDTIRTMFETNIGNRLSIEAIKAIGGIANGYIGRKTIDVNKTKQ